MAVDDEQDYIKGAQNSEASIKIGQGRASAHTQLSSHSDADTRNAANEADRLDKALTRIAFALERKTQKAIQPSAEAAESSHAILQSLAANLDMLMSRVRTLLNEVEEGSGKLSAEISPKKE